MPRGKLKEAKSKIKNVAKYKKLQKLEDILVYGDEPTYTGDPNSSKYRYFEMTLFNWLNNMYEYDDYKNFFKEYCNTLDYDFDVVAKLPSYDFRKIGTISYVMMSENTHPKSYLEKFDNALFELISKSVVQVEIKEEFEPEEKMTKRSKDCIVYVDAYSEFDQMIKKDRLTEDEISSYIKQKSINIQVLKLLEQHYKDDVTDYTDSIATLDKRLKTHNVQKSVYTKYLQASQLIFDTITKVLNNVTNVKSANRKPRKKRKVDTTKLVAKLQYMLSDKSLSLESINPESIIGKKNLLIFNTKTRKFGIFYAADETGLNVKGSTIINFDEEKSVCKTLRKPNEQIVDLTSLSIRNIKKNFDAIKAVETSLKGRINKDTLILKVL